MITFRRFYLDQQLESCLGRMSGNVLDIGGNKKNKRGKFRPPAGLNWKYANPNSAAEPDWVCGAESVPVPDSSFNLVVMTEVLEYVATPGEALAEAHRILEPGGELILSVPFQCPVHGDFDQDYYRFTRAGLSRLLLEVGFKDLDIREMGSVGAVLFDAFEAATGYAHPLPRSLKAKILRKILYRCVFIFRFLERVFRVQQNYITTGYFVLARK